MHPYSSLSPQKSCLSVYESSRSIVLLSLSSLTRRKKQHLWVPKRTTGIISVTVWPKSKEQMMEFALLNLFRRYFMFVSFIQYLTTFVVVGCLLLCWTCAYTHTQTQAFCLDLSICWLQFCFYNEIQKILWVWLICSFLLSHKDSMTQMPCSFKNGTSMWQLVDILLIVVGMYCLNVVE